MRHAGCHLAENCRKTERRQEALGKRLARSYKIGWAGGIASKIPDISSGFVYIQSTIVEQVKGILDTGIVGIGIRVAQAGHSFRIGFRSSELEVAIIGNRIKRSGSSVPKSTESRF